MQLLSLSARVKAQASSNEKCRRQRRIQVLCAQMRMSRVPIKSILSHLMPIKPNIYSHACIVSWLVGWWEAQKISSMSSIAVYINLTVWALNYVCARILCWHCAHFHVWNHQTDIECFYHPNESITHSDEKTSIHKRTQDIYAQHKPKYTNG